MIIHELILPRLKTKKTDQLNKISTQKRYVIAHDIFGLFVWIGLSILCISYPIMDNSRYGKDYSGFHWFAFGPTFLLSITMTFIYLRNVLSRLPKIDKERK